MMVIIFSTKYVLNRSYTVSSLDGVVDVVVGAAAAATVGVGVSVAVGVAVAVTVDVVVAAGFF